MLLYESSIKILHIENFYNERRIKIKQRNLVINFFYCVYLLLFIRPQYLLDLTKRSNWGVFLSHKTPLLACSCCCVHHLLYPHRVSCYDIQLSKPHTASSFHPKKEIYPPSGLVTQRRYYFKKIIHIHPTIPPLFISFLFQSSQIYSHTATTLVSQSQCRLINPILILLRFLALTTTSWGIKPQPQPTEISKLAPVPLILEW